MTELSRLILQRAEVEWAGCEEGNQSLALAIRKVAEIREGSWNEGRGEYDLLHRDCISYVVGDDPIAIILACLFTAGYSDIYDFTHKVLGEGKGNE